MLYEYKIFNDNQVIILILIVRVMVNPLFDALFNRESTIKKWRCFLTINSRAPIALWFGLKMFYSWSLYSSHANLPSQKPILFSNIPNHLFLVFMIGLFLRITQVSVEYGTVILLKVIHILLLVLVIKIMKLISTLSRYELHEHHFRAEFFMVHKLWPIIYES